MMSFMDGAMRRFGGIIERRGGRVIKYMGDGLMAVFGIPFVQEDDAERAVRAGLDLLAEAEVYDGDVKVSWGFGGIDVRVGVDTGPIILGGGIEDERTAIGMTVNLASRMEKTAPVGGLRITHATYQQVHGIFEVEAQPPLLVKGKTEALQTYLVNRALPRSFQKQRYGILGIQTPMVGRNTEFEQLCSVFRNVTQQTRAQAITIVGEAGIGKSRLLIEFEQWLAHRPELTHSFQARGFRPFQGTPYGVLRMLIANHCQIMDSDPANVVHHKLEVNLSKHLAAESLMKVHIIGALLGYPFSESPSLGGRSFAGILNGSCRFLCGPGSYNCLSCTKRASGATTEMVYLCV
jgi:hypothetical protein